ncbi:MAG TPA: SPOR domain-containing protein [Vicinamibacteria bacterium]|nr:SPOR domain-containing protein [Vicinamibacteria bacterium]
MAQDDYYYEIQLTNKQLVFYFLAGATGLILSFLAGVMVGRGVDQSAGEVQAARPVAEERVVTEETPKPVPPAAEELTYAQRLESDKTDDGLEKGKGGTSAAKPARPVTPPVTTAAVPATTMPAAAPPVTVAAVPRPTPPKPTPAPATASKPVKGPGGPIGSIPTAGNFTIQVGAFKDKASADSVVARLKNKGFAAYVVSPEGEGLFNVRVGNFPARPEAERVAARLRDEEKFKPFIVKP